MATEAQQQIAREARQQIKKLLVNTRVTTTNAFNAEVETIILSAIERGYDFGYEHGATDQRKGDAAQPQRSEQPTCKCVEQGYPEQDCKLHGEKAQRSDQQGWEYQRGGWFRQKGIEKGKTAPVIHAPELVEQLTATLTSERQLKIQDGLDSDKIIAQLTDQLTAEREIAKEWFDKWGDEKASKENTERLLTAECQRREQAERELASEIDLKRGTYRILQREKEQVLIHCHMALIGVWPASDAWGEVQKWLETNGESEYADKLRGQK